MEEMDKGRKQFRGNSVLSAEQADKAEEIICIQESEALH